MYNLSNIQVFWLVTQYSCKNIIWEGHQRIYRNPLFNDNIEKDLATVNYYYFFNNYVNYMLELGKEEQNSVTCHLRSFNYTAGLNEINSGFFITAYFSVLCLSYCFLFITHTYTHKLNRGYKSTQLYVYKYTR